MKGLRWRLWCSRSADGVLQFAGAAVHPAAQLLFGEQSEPALDQVEPGAAGGSARGDSYRVRTSMHSEAAA